jgi:ribosome maturation factor RimP
LDRTTIGEIRSVLDSVLGERGLLLVDLTTRGHGNSVVLEVYIDGVEPVVTDLCAHVSRSVSDRIEERGLLPGGFSIMVSSPGLDRPLRFPRQYPKHVGRVILVTMGTGAEAVTLRGTLVAATDRAISVRQEGVPEPREILFDDIVTAKIESRW